MLTRITCQQLMLLKSDPELAELLARADVIGAMYVREQSRVTTIWERPAAEVEARGLPADVQIVTIEVESADDLRKCRVLVRRLKEGNDRLAGP